MCRILSIGLVLLLPPLVWWNGLESPWVGVLLLVIGVLQLLGAHSGFQYFQAVLAIGVALFVAFGSRRLTLYYPALVNATLLMIWAYSWFHPPTVVERFAPAAHAADPHKQRYMRRLTLAWCGVFTVNLLLALVTAQLTDLVWWTAWNGLGAYLLVGLFAGGEYLFRKRRERAIDRGAPV